MKTLYDVLGVDRQASLADIEQSYRHGLNQLIAGNPRSRKRPLRKKDLLRMQQMREAYLLLASPARRLDYDVRLEQMMLARMRTAVRVRMAFGVLLLVAGVALIGGGYYRMQAQEAASAPISSTEKMRDETRTAALPAESEQTLNGRSTP